MYILTDPVYTYCFENFHSFSNVPQYDLKYVSCIIALLVKFAGLAAVQLVRKVSTNAFENHLCIILKLLISFNKIGFMVYLGGLFIGTWVFNEE